jgi:hypothetical protein
VVRRVVASPMHVGKEACCVACCDVLWLLLCMLVRRLAVALVATCCGSPMHVGKEACCVACCDVVWLRLCTLVRRLAVSLLRRCCRSLSLSTQLALMQRVRGVGVFDTAYQLVVENDRGRFTAAGVDTRRQLWFGLFRGSAGDTSLADTELALVLVGRIVGSTRQYRECVVWGLSTRLIDSL